MQRLRRSSTALRGHLRSRSRSRQTRATWDDVKPNVIVTGEGLSFDPQILTHLKEEGFSVIYLPYTGHSKDYSHQLQGLEDSLEFGYRYAIVGTPALCFASAEPSSFNTIATDQWLVDTHGLTRVTWYSIW